jgi:hypothetical protein
MKSNNPGLNMTATISPTSLSRWTTWLTGVLLAALLSACGGGAGQVGLPTGTPLYTTAPAAVTLAAAAKLDYTIGGGTPLYTASSSNKAVATASVSGTVLSIVGVGAGTATVTVTDAVGALTSVSVTVSSTTQPPGTTPPALFTTAAGSLSVAAGASATYAIGGGVPAYAVSSSNNSVATATVSGSNFSVTGVGAGAAQIVVTDAAGTALTVAVQVGGGATPIALFTTAPGSVTLAVEANASFSMGGGAPPYSASTSNAGIARVATNGSAILITGVSTGSAQVVLADSAGAAITVDVTVGASTAETALFLTAPDAVTLATGEVAAYTVGGGKPAYSVSTSNASVARVVLNGSAFSLTAVAAGSAKITITDTVGTTRSVDVTVASATQPPPPPADPTVTPASASGNVGDTLSFLIRDGTPGFTVTMNNTSIATIDSVSGSAFTVRLNNVGDTSATITDAAGKVAVLPISVSQSTPSLRLSPNAVLVAEDFLGPITLNIFGGTGPYRAFTSDEKLSSVSISGATLTVAVGQNLNRCINPITADGTYIPNGTFDVTITTLDSLGASATSIMTIKDNGAGFGTGCP